MAEIRALIVDDEPLARRGIRQLLEPHADVVVVGECRDGPEAVRSLATLRPDLVFLDIHMPGLDGLDVIRIHGVERMPVTVFVTAHDEFAVGAFEAQALDYLMKPLSETRFRVTMARVRERIRMNDAVSLARRLTALLEGDVATPRGSTGPERTAPSRPDAALTVPTESGERLIDAADVDWIEARDYQTALHVGGETHLVRQSMAALEKRLDPARFVRIHRSAIVRLDRVREWKAGGADREAVVVLRDGTELRVSRRRLARVKALLRAGRTR